MNTLKLKVLLMLTNKHFVWSISRSLLIWLCTCFIGSAIHAVIFQAFPLLESYALSLLFSSPVLLVAVPTLYTLPSLQTISFRITFSSAIILITCAVIIGFVSIFFNLPYEIVAAELLPFIPSAAVCYFLFVRKQLLKPFYKTYHQ